MKLETTAGMLKAALNAVKPAMPSRSTRPILLMVKFDGKTVQGTNLDMWIKADLPARVARGALCVPFAPLISLVRHISADQGVVIEGDAEGGVTVSFGTSAYDLPAMDAADFPDFAGIDAGVMRIDGDGLKKALAFVAPSISTEETRYYLNGVYLDDTLAVATDGRRAAVHPLGFAVGEARGIVPVDAIRALLGMPPMQSLQLETAKNRFVFKGPGVTLSGKLIDGKYPDWRRVVPTFQNEFSELRADRSALRQALARLASVDPSARTVTIAWQDDMLAAVMRRRDMGWGPKDKPAFGREQMGIPAASIGGGGRFSVNVQYFLSALRLINRDEVEIRMQGMGAPMLLRGDGEAFMIVMPMRDGFESEAAAGAMLTEAAKRKLVEAAA